MASSIELGDFGARCPSMASLSEKDLSGMVCAWCPYSIDNPPGSERYTFLDQKAVEELKSRLPVVTGFVREGIPIEPTCPRPELAQVVFDKWQERRALEMKRVEDLPGVFGTFTGSVHRHPLGLKMRAVAVGSLTYVRPDTGEEVTVEVCGVSVRRLGGSYDTRRYIRIERGPKGNRDKIVALVDTN